MEWHQAALSSEIDTGRQTPVGESDNLANRIERLEDTHKFVDESALLKGRQQQFKNALTLRPVSRKVLDLLVAGHQAEAIAAIESSSADPLTF
jgi:hypothetical protein